MKLNELNEAFSSPFSPQISDGDAPEEVWKHEITHVTLFTVPSRLSDSLLIKAKVLGVGDLQSLHTLVPPSFPDLFTYSFVAHPFRLNHPDLGCPLDTPSRLLPLTFAAPCPWKASCRSANGTAGHLSLFRSLLTYDLPSEAIPGPAVPLLCLMFLLRPFSDIPYISPIYLALSSFTSR